MTLALHFDLKVNGDFIGRFVAQRREAVIPADWTCTYDITVTDPDGTRTCVIRHNYRDGAFQLVTAALATLAERNTE